MGIWEALGLDLVRHRVVALVGAGGKTSTLYALARQARDAGRTVIVTTTTHILPHPRLFLTGEAGPDRLRALLAEHGVLTLGRFDRPDKLSGVDVAAARRAADTVVVEADGARLRPLKAPAGHEPVIPPCADAVIAVAGLDAVGQPIGAACHRPERVAALLGTGPDHLLTPDDVAAVLASPQGGRKGVAEGVAFRCLLNKADTAERAAFAREIQAQLARLGVRCAVTSYPEEERGGRCLF